MKLSVFSLLTGELSFEDAAALLARLGYEGVEWRVWDVPKDAKGDSHWSRAASTIDLHNLDEQVKRAKKAADDHNLEVCALTSYLPPSEPERVEALFKQAAAIGCGMVRVVAPGYRRDLNYNDVYEKAVRDYSEIEKLGKKYEVKALLELHMGNIIPSASLGRRLCENFDPKYIGVIFDPGNMVFEGYENWRMGLQLLGPYLAHVHVKNLAWGPTDINEDGTLLWAPRNASMRTGQANWGEIIGDLKSVGYEGWLSMEDFFEQPVEKKLEEDARYLRQLLAKS